MSVVDNAGSGGGRRQAEPASVDRTIARELDLPTPAVEGVQVGARTAGCPVALVPMPVVAPVLPGSPRWRDRL